VSEAITEQVQGLSLEVHDILGLEHYSRTDFILDKNDNIFILEANTLPGMTKTSLVPKAALAAGLDFKALVGRLLAMATGSDKKKLRADNE
jgi:D-alanine-D-alanine ligase